MDEIGPAAILSILVQAQGVAKTSAQLEKLDRTAKQTAASTDNLDKKFTSLDRSVGDFNRTMSAARNTVSLVKFPALIAGAGMATQAVGALAAGAVSLGAALGPLAGAGAAGAAGMVAMGQAAGVAKLATLGLGDAIKGQKGAMDKLSPVQRNFVKDIRALKQETQALRGDAQRGLLPGLDKALGIVTPLITKLRPIVKGTADAMGDLAVSGARVVRSWGSDLQAVGKTNITVIKNLGTATIAAADGARHLVVAGGPLLTWLSSGAVSGAKWVKAQIAAGRESGRLAGFLEKTRDVMGTLGRIAVNLGAALFGIGKAAAPLGRDLLGLFEDLTKKFREWVESATGRNTLDDYFRSAREPILQVAGLIGDVGAAFLRLSTPGPESGGLIAKMRELVPILENVVASTTAAFGPVLVDALGNVVRLFGELAGTSGPLTVFVQLIGVLAGGLADLLSNNPALNSMVVSFIGFAGVVKALSLVSLVTGFTALGGVIAGTAAAYTAMAAGATAATVAQERGVIATVAARAAILTTTAAVAAWTTAQWLLNAALTANPIGLVIVGLVALGAAFVVAYTKVTFFRNAVNATFNWIKANWPLVLGILTGPIGLAVLAIAKNWGAIKAAFSSGVSAIVGILRGSVGAIAGAGAAMGRALINSFKAALNFAHELAVAMRDLISKAPGYALGVGKAIVSGIISGIKAAADGIGNALKGAVKGATPDFLGIGDGIGKSIGAGTIVPVKGGGSLMGARPIMSKFAAIGAAGGLHVSSGIRPGAMTSSGNPSWHATGEAIDLSNGKGPDAAKMGVFRTLRSRFGSRLAELIYTPGGSGIKDGKPYTYTGQVARDHLDHIHVAFDSGKPGLGDGLGKMQATGTGIGDGLGGNVKAVWQFLIAKGFTPAQAAGIIGVMQGESGKGLSTTATNKKSGAYGIAQWLGGRKSALMGKKNPSSLQTQLSYLWSELQGPEKASLAKIKGAHSIDEAVSAWLFSFERPGKGEANLPGRTANARSVFAALKGVGGKGASKGARGKTPQDTVSNYEMIQAMADTAITQAQSTPKLADDILANTQLRDATTFRIKQVRAALKKPNLKPSTRLRLTQELGGLVGKHTELQGTLKDLREQPGKDLMQRGSDLIDARLAITQTTETLTDDLGPLGDKVQFLTKIYEAQSKKFGASSLEAAQAFADLTSASQTLAKTQRDAIYQPFQQMLQAGSAQLTMAQVFSPGDTGDDITALTNSLGVATQAFLEAVNRGDTDAINEFGGQVLSLRDSIEQLQASVTQNTQAMLDLVTQQRDDARKAANVSQSQYGVLAKAIADVASGQIGGRVGLGFMSPSFPGGGSRY